MRAFSPQLDLFLLLLPSTYLSFLLDYPSSSFDYYYDYWLPYLGIQITHLIHGRPL